MFMDPRPSCVTNLKPLQRFTPRSSNFKVSKIPSCVWKFAIVKTHNERWILCQNNGYFKFDRVWIKAMIKELWSLLTKCGWIGMATLDDKIMVGVASIIT